MKLIEKTKVNGKSTIRLVEADRSRSSFSYPSFMLMGDESGFETSSSDLAIVGLSGYEGTLSSNGLFTVTKNGESCSEITIPDSSDIRLCFWKALFSQSSEIVTDDDFDYSVNVSGEDVRVKLHSQQTSLVSGKQKDLSLPYLLEDIRPLYNTEGQAHYALAYVFPITDGHLEDNLSIYVINNEGEVVYDATDDPAYQYGTCLITPYRLFDPISQSLIDFDFKVVATLDDKIIRHNSAYELMQTEKNGIPHLYNFAGDVLIDSGYSYLNADIATESRIYGVTDAGVPVSIQPFDKTNYPFPLAASETMKDLGFGIVRVDNANLPSGLGTRYFTYYQSSIGEFNLPLFFTSNGSSSLFDYLIDSYFDPQYNSYSFFTLNRTYTEPN